MCLLANIWREQLANFQYLNPHFSEKKQIHWPMFGFIHGFKDCPMCVKIEDPLEFFKRGGTASQLIASGEVNNEEGVVDGRLLLIHWRWPFEGNMVDLRVFRENVREHFERADYIKLWPDIPRQFFEIPATRLIDLASMRANSRQVFLRFIVNVRLEVDRQDVAPKEIKCADRKLYKCFICKYPAVPYPVQCVTNSGHHLAHYYCVVNACKEIEENKLMSVQHILCKDQKCEKPLPVLISEENLPTIQTMLLLWETTKACKLCKTFKFLTERHHCGHPFANIDWAEDFDRQIKLDLKEKFPEEDEEPEKQSICGEEVSDVDDDLQDYSSQESEEVPNKQKKKLIVDSDSDSENESSAGPQTSTPNKSQSNESEVPPNPLSEISESKGPQDPEKENQSKEEVSEIERVEGKPGHTSEKIGQPSENPQLEDEEQVTGFASDDEEFWSKEPPEENPEPITGEKQDTEELEEETEGELSLEKEPVEPQVQEVAPAEEPKTFADGETQTPVTPFLIIYEGEQEHPRFKKKMVKGRFMTEDTYKKYKADNDLLVEQNNANTIQYNELVKEHNKALDEINSKFWDFEDVRQNMLYNRDSYEKTVDRALNLMHIQFRAKLRLVEECKKMAEPLLAIINDIKAVSPEEEERNIRDTLLRYKIEDREKAKRRVKQLQKKMEIDQKGESDDEDSDSGSEVKIIKTVRKGSSRKSLQRNKIKVGPKEEKEKSGSTKDPDQSMEKHAARDKATGQYKSIKTPGTPKRGREEVLKEHCYSGSSSSKPKASTPKEPEPKDDSSTARKKRRRD